MCRNTTWQNSLAMIAAVFLTSCISTTPYQQRGVEAPVPESAVRSLEYFEASTHEGVRLDAEARSIEHFADPDFTIGVIEINDRGDTNPAQYDQVLGAIRNSIKKAAADGRKTTLVTFVHGWHHSCRVCDDNLTCFRRVMAELSRQEVGSAKPRNIIGLYIGWRGRRYIGKVDVVSIWNRKSVAEDIGQRGGKEVLNRLHAIWIEANGNVTMVTVGHSLGAALLLTAVRANLTGNVDDIVNDEGGNFRIVRAAGLRDATSPDVKAERARFGDLVVLLNPAIEAVQYGIFDRDLRDEMIQNPHELAAKGLPPDKLAPYSRDQLPIMITIAGKADTAVGRIFQIARSIQGQLIPSHRLGLGHWEPEITHTLHYTGTLKKDQAHRCACAAVWTTEQRALGIPTIFEAPEEKMNSLFAQFRLSALFPTEKDRTILKLTSSRDCTSTPCRGWDPNSPYLVIQADSTVIRDHDDIFNPAIVGFLKQYLQAYQNTKPAIGVPK